MHGRLRTVVPVTTTPLGMDSGKTASTQAALKTPAVSRPGATWGSASWDLGLATAPPSAQTAPTRARLASLQRREVDSSLPTRCLFREALKNGKF